jgi:hypothetical protein
MDDLYAIELEPEVRSWLVLLPRNHHRKVEEYVELLATLGPQTPMPFARPLEEGVYELRPTLGGTGTRITYWFAPERRIVLLTVFRKTRMHEAAQIARAVAARRMCAVEHGPAHETYGPEEKGESR